MIADLAENLVSHKVVCALGLVPYTQNPLDLAISIALTRFGITAKAIHSKAPALALWTVGVILALLCSGMMSASAPAHSAFLMMAPRFCGSSIWSRKTKTELDLLADFSIISFREKLLGRGALAMIP